jgi:hypothetical protein
MSRKRTIAMLAVGGLIALAVAVAPQPSRASSHREAPLISLDPAADSTDLYAFVSPDRPDTVTLIANYVPLEAPDGGPNFYEFGDDVLYAIHVDRTGDGRPDLSYEFRFTTRLRNPDTFLYNTGPIASLDDPNWNRRQFYSVRRVRHHGHDHDHDHEADATTLAADLASPPCNIGPRSTPNYTGLVAAAIHSLPGGGKVFAGQRQEGFYVDLGSIFDLGALRPFQNLHLIPMAAAPGINGTQGTNVHSIALQVPITEVTGRVPASSDAGDRRAVVGVWTAAYRRRATIRRGEHGVVESGPWVQVSRLGNPLFNEVIVPMGDKDEWNAVPPDDDHDFLKYVEHPELARLIPVLYPGVFPHLAAFTGKRADLVAILLTGIPSGVVPGFQNYTGRKPADELRLNVAVPPSTTGASIYGILGGDLAGYPNGRRVRDDVTAIELRAIAGATLPLVDASYTPDAAAAGLTDGLTDTNSHISYLDVFPYLGTPLGGFDHPAS